MTQTQAETTERERTDGFKPGVRVRRIGRELRRWRERLDLTGNAAAKRVRWSPAKLSKIENALQPITGVEVLALAIVYDIGDAERERLFRAALTASDHGWWQDYDEDALVSAAQDFVELESEARLLRTFKPDLIPGLLQTERYATELARASLPQPSEDTIEHRAQARAIRQARLTGEEPMRIEAVIWEAALRQRVGGDTVMGAQLDKLAELSQWPNVGIQVLPLGCGAYPAMGSSFDMLAFAEESYNDVVYAENLHSGSYVEEPSDVERYILHFEALQRASLDPDVSTELITAIAGELAT